MEVFIPQKLANATKQGFPLPHETQSLNTYQHLCSHQRGSRHPSLLADLLIAPRHSTPSPGSRRRKRSRGFGELLEGLSRAAPGEVPESPRPRPRRGGPAAGPPIGCRSHHLPGVNQEARGVGGLPGPTPGRGRTGMTGARRWAPLLLCLLQSAPGRPLLAPPQNVTLLSRNFSVYLTWLPGPGNPQNVTYFVAYQSFVPPRRWRRVKACAGTKELVCSLMCLEKQDLCNKFKGRVQAVSPSARSPWVESKSMDYFFEVEPAPPVLVFSQTEEILIVNATYQLPHCVPQPDLNYEVDFWKEGTKNKVRSPSHAPKLNLLPHSPSRPPCSSPSEPVPECLLQEAFHAYPS
uniref:Interferon lambda receptor 1 n=1 Tax=Ovis aries TaxID=9940 RepID=A0AC11EGI5_SHEEP